MRKFFNKEHYFIHKADGTDNSNRVFWNKDKYDVPINKITGTRFGTFLNKNKYEDEFSVFCKMFEINKPILDFKYINAGLATEKKFIERFSKEIGYPIKTFDELKKQPNSSKYDCFPKHCVFGGVPDGYIESERALLEFKTTSHWNEKHWHDKGVPENYIKQAELYAYLLEAQTYSIVVMFLENEDYEKPDSIPVAFRKIKVFGPYILDREMVAKEMEIAKWKRNAWILTGKSPKFDFMKHKDLLDYLKCENEAAWEQLQEKWRLEGKYGKADRWD